MKKIGIVTWFGGSNYGTSLQAYALYHTVEQLGAKAYLLRKHLSWRNVIGNFIRYIKGTSRPMPNQGLSSQKQKKIQTFKQNAFQQFPLCYGFIGKLIYSLQIQKLNCIISGSDQLWNPYHTEPFLLLQNFKTKKYSYASSIGVTDIPTQYHPLYKKALATYSAISVRESTAIPILKHFTNCPITKVVDPTFLLTKHDWIKFASNSSLSITFQQPYILCYFVAENGYYWERLQELQKVSGISRVVVLPMKPGHFKNEYEIIESAGLEDFVQLIAQSSIVCTDSFHATTISINLQKDFITLLRFKSSDSISQNSRIYDLLERYKLTNRLLDSPITSTLMPIDYTETSKILERDRQDSIKYLKHILNEI